MEACPCCYGSGRCKVTMMGWRNWWVVDCVDCGGKGEVYYYRAHRLRLAIAARTARGFPRVPPEGLIGPP